MAAGALIVHEAGGRVTRYDDAPLDLFGGEIVASNGHVHAAMLDVIAERPRRVTPLLLERAGVREWRGPRAVGIIPADCRHAVISPLLGRRS